MYRDKKIVFLFSGIGSQYADMGEPFFREYKDYRKQMEYLDDMFYIHTGYSIIEELYVKHNEKIISANSALACVALFEVQYAMAQFLIEQGVVPDILLGTSLGEYVSYAVSGGIESTQAMIYLYDVIDVIQKCSLKSGMLTILGDVRGDYQQDENINMLGLVAAINYDGHFVVSGKEKEVDRLAEYYKGKEIFTYKVPSTVAFHNVKMLTEYEDIANCHMRTIDIGNLQIPVVSCMKGKLLREVRYSYLYDIIKKPILFKTAIESIDKREGFTFLDLGPMGTLENFVKKSIKNGDVDTFSFMNCLRDRWKEFKSS